RMLVDPLQVLQGIAGAEGVSAEVLVAGKAYMHEGKAVVLQGLLDDLHRLLPLRGRGLGHKGGAGRLDDVTGVVRWLHHAVRAGVGDVARRRRGGELAASGLIAHVVLADDGDAEVAPCRVY